MLFADSRSDPRYTSTGRRSKTAQDLVGPSQLDRGAEPRGWGPPFALPELKGTTRYVPTSRVLQESQNFRPARLGDTPAAALARDFERLLSVARKTGKEPTKEHLEKYEALQQRIAEEEAEAERILQESKVKAIKKRQVSGST